MKKIILFYSMIISLSVSSSALAQCRVAVGGPNANSSALADLSDSLMTMFEKEKNLVMSVYPVSSLPEAVSEESDFMVYLTGNSSGVRVQFRHLLLNKVMMEKNYSSALKLDGAIAKITSDVQKNIVPQLPSYCYNDQ